jgi:hypothetical protein
VSASADRAAEPSSPWREWIRHAEDPARVAEKPEALDDLLVLDCSVGHYGGHVLAGFLGELGAEVVKLEPPDGDPARAWGPADATAGGTGLAFLAEGRNRAYATLDLAHPEGQELLRQLAGRADVLIEGFPAGRWTPGDRLPSAPAAQSRLVYVALSTRPVRTPAPQAARVRPDRPGPLGADLHHRRAGDDRPESRPTRVKLDQRLRPGGVGRDGDAGRAPLARSSGAAGEAR